MKTTLTNVTSYNNLTNVRLVVEDMHMETFSMILTFEHATLTRINVCGEYASYDISLHSTITEHSGLFQMFGDGLADVITDALTSARDTKQITISLEQLTTWDYFLQACESFYNLTHNTHKG